MNDAKRKRSKGLLPRHLAVRLERMAGSGGIVAFMADPVVDAPAPAPAPEPAPAPPAPAPSAAPAATPAPAPAATPAPSAAPAATPAPSAAPAAPEAYTDFTLPEGVKPDEAVMGEFKAIAKQLNLPQEAAQQLVDLNARVEVARAEHVKATVAAWEGAAKTDAEFGGDKYDENMAVVAAARDKFATPEFVKFLADTKLGSHPEMLRTFYRIGKAISEDGFVPGRPGNTGGKSLAQQMYPNMNP